MHCIHAPVPATENMTSNSTFFSGGTVKSRRRFSIYVPEWFTSLIKARVSCRYVKVSSMATTSRNFPFWFDFLITKSPKTWMFPSKIFSISSLIFSQACSFLSALSVFLNSSTWSFLSTSVLSSSVDILGNCRINVNMHRVLQRYWRVLLSFR